MPRSRKSITSLLLSSLLLASAAASAVEYPIGTPQQRNGMEIAAVYLQPVTMEPDGMMRKAEESDVHMEADIHALASNPNGFEEGAWMPYLMIKYEVTKQGTNEKISGDFMPMVANDGPHYGANLKMAGLGKYKLTYIVQPPGSGDPDAPVRQGFGRAAKVPWWKPFQVEWAFTYLGPGKKGGY